jgi:branched-chain amino acid transport system ATP-binding protein
MTVMLEVKNLACVIGEQHILNSVSFSIQSGETVGIIGPNGSGKTTLFNCLSGFQPAQSGSILLKGVEVIGKAAHERAQLGIGRVFQNFGIFRDSSILDNVVIALESKQGLGATFFPWSAQNKRNRIAALEVLASIGLEHKANAKASSLSGGQMRLLEIARTLAFGAELFLLDEPTAGVSPKMKEDVAKLLSRLRAAGKTVLVIEHDINFIQKFCSRVLVLDSGRLVLDDKPDVVQSHPLLREIYFGVG